MATSPDIRRHTPYDELPELLSVEEFCTVAAIGRSTVYELVRTNKLTYKRFGRIVRIPKSELRLE